MTLKTGAKQANRGKFKPGQSGNPGGRPRGYAELTRKRVGQDGQPIIDTLMLIAYGEQADIKKTLGAPASIKDRLTALQQLKEHGWGKDTQGIDVGGVVVLKWQT